jgi:formylglycine-generating enzyme required for sulfatase activity
VPKSRDYGGAPERGTASGGGAGRHLPAAVAGVVAVAALTGIGLWWSHVQTQVRERDDERFANAAGLDRPEAFEAYLSDCARGPCTHRGEAEARLAAMADEAARSAAQERLTRQTAARERLARGAEAQRQRRATAEAARNAHRGEPFPFEPEMVRIPAGSFLMGSPETEPESYDDEGPQHWVQVPAFEMSKYEVTFEQWDACVVASGCEENHDDAGWGRGDRPVINVSWANAQRYVQWLSRSTGKAYRLPSEAEWEYAARAGSTAPFSTGECISTHQANYDGNYPYHNCPETGVYLAKTQPVGRYPANPWGLHDMHGNVYEWVDDCWNDSYAGGPADGSAWRMGDCNHHVLRGGSWNLNAHYMRSASRGHLPIHSRSRSLGLRLAAGLEPGPGRLEPTPGLPRARTE